MIEGNAILEMRELACHGVVDVFIFAWEHSGDANVVQWGIGHLTSASDDWGFLGNDNNVFVVIHVDRARIEDCGAVIVTDLPDREE